MLRRVVSPQVNGAAGRRRPTMRDVAAAAGVSFKTVSRVVNGEPGVSAAMAERVRQSVDELGFRPNIGASSLRRADGKTSSIALLLDDVANPFSASLLRVVEDVANEFSVVVHAASLDERADRERELAALFASRGTDGLIIAPSAHDQSHLAAEMATGVKVVLVDRAPRGLDADCVLSTNASGSAAAVRHLAASGHRRIGFLGDERSISTAQLRLAGYHAAVHALGLDDDAGLVIQDVRNSAAAEEAATELLSRPDRPTALFTARNTITIGAIGALSRLGLRQRVALVGFDDFPLADLLDPPVSVIAQDIAAIGELAARLLFQRLAGDDSPYREHLIETELICRGSGEIGPH